MPDSSWKKTTEESSAPELRERRERVIHAYTRGLNKKQISRAAIGLSYPAVRNIIARYAEKGVESLVPSKKGRKEGENRALSEDQEAQIRRIICEKRPEQLKMEFALWNRGAVKLLIAQECGIKLHIRAVGNYLKRWGFTPQKPIKRLRAAPGSGEAMPG